MSDPQEVSAQQRIWQIVSRIPAGRVASYGQVAELAGLPRAARLVGTTLKQLPQGSRLPWHRVVTSQGKIAFAEDSAAFHRQRSRLRREGIPVPGNRVDMAQFRWRP